jgi:hypothetical protein
VAPQIAERYPSTPVLTRIASTGKDVSVAVLAGKIERIGAA